MLLEDVDCFELVDALCGALHEEFMDVFQRAIPDLPEVSIFFVIHSIILVVQTCWSVTHYACQSMLMLVCMVSRSNLHLRLAYFCRRPHTGHQ